MKHQMLKICMLLACNTIASSPVYTQSVIGGTNGNPSAVLELRSSSRGLLLPRLTSSERSAIVSPAEGLIIYNTTESCTEINLGTSSNPDWSCLLAITGRVMSVDCGAAINTGTLTLGVPASGVISSVPYSGGNGSFYNSQTVNSTGVTGLTASLAAGTFANGSGSVSFAIIGTPSASGIASFELKIGGQTCTLNLSVGCGAYVGSGVWKEFMCHNLGANTEADPFTPSWELIGNYYQWGRNPTCFGFDGSDSHSPCSSPVFGAAAPWGSTEANDNAWPISGWSATDAPNDAWSDDSKTANDPCPLGYRVPTADQWSGVIDVGLNERTSVGTWANSTTNYSSGILFGSSMLLPIAGYRFNSSGTLFSRGSIGFYWSSTESDSNSQSLYIINGNASIYNMNRTFGFSLRCIAE